MRRHEVRCDEVEVDGIESESDENWLRVLVEGTLESLENIQLGSIVSAAAENDDLFLLLLDLVIEVSWNPSCLRQRQLQQVQRNLYLSLS